MSLDMLGGVAAAVTPVYFPQFAAAGVAAGGAVAPAQASAVYMEAGQAMLAIATSQRLEGMYISLGHGLGCTCQFCRVALAAVGGPAPNQLQAPPGVSAAVAVSPAGGPSSSSSSSPIQDDPYGVAQSGQGAKSNLANSPEAMLALQDILSSGGAKSYDDVQKELHDKYGIQCEVSDISVDGKDGKSSSVKGIKFPNGDYFIDGNGNGQLDTGDYKFADAVKALKDKYNLSDDRVKSIVDNLKSTADQRNQAASNPQGAYAYAGYGYPTQGIGLPPNGYPPPGLGQPNGAYGYPTSPGYPPQAVPEAVAALFPVGAPNLMFAPEANQGWMLLFLQAYLQAAGTLQ